MGESQIGIKQAYKDSTELYKIGGPSNNFENDQNSPSMEGYTEIDENLVQNMMDRNIAEEEKEYQEDEKKRSQINDTLRYGSAESQDSDLAENQDEVGPDIDKF